MTADLAAALDQIPAPAAPAADESPAKAPRKSRSGTTGAERRRRAKAASGDKAPGAAPAKRTPAVPPLERELAERLKMVVELLGIVDGRDAAVIEHNRTRLASVLARKYPKIAGAVVKLLSFGDELDGIMLLGLVVGQIADNHGLLPASASAGVKLGAMLTNAAPPAATVAKAQESRTDLGAALGPLLSVLTAPAPTAVPETEPTPAVAEAAVA